MVFWDVLEVVQIVVDMDGGAYLLADVLALLGHRPGDALDVRMDGGRLVIAVSAEPAELPAAEPSVQVAG